MRIKKLCLMILLGVMVMIINGCEVEAMPGDELAKMKLEEKYQKSFEIEEIRSTNMMEKYYTAIAYPVDDPMMLFEVNVNFDGTAFSDNYVSKCVFRKIADVVGQNMDNLNGYFYIYATPLVDRTGLDNPEISVEEYLEKFPNGKINVYIHYAPQNLDADKLYVNLERSFDGLGGASGMIYLSIVDENGLDAIQDYLESTDRIYDEYDALIKPFYKGNIVVTKGKLDCDKAAFEEMLRK